MYPGNLRNRRLSKHPERGLDFASDPLSQEALAGEEGQRREAGAAEPANLFSIIGGLQRSSSDAGGVGDYDVRESTIIGRMEDLDQAVNADDKASLFQAFTPGGISRVFIPFDEPR